MNRSFVYGGVAVLIIGVIIGAYLYFQLPEPDAPMASAPPAETAPAGSDAETDTPPEAAPATIAPSFDVVRVDENGNVVIAGRATPGCVIVVREGDLEIRPCDRIGRPRT